MEDIYDAVAGNVSSVYLHVRPDTSSGVKHHAKTPTSTDVLQSRSLTSLGLGASKDLTRYNKDCE